MQKNNSEEKAFKYILQNKNFRSLANCITQRLLDTPKFSRLSKDGGISRNDRKQIFDEISQSIFELFTMFEDEDYSKLLSLIIEYDS